MAKEYWLIRQVEGIDVFCVVPLAVVADNKKLWRPQFGSLGGIIATVLRTHNVRESHYTMNDEQNVFGFQKVLRKVMQARGL